MVQIASAQEQHYCGIVVPPTVHYWLSWWSNVLFPTSFVIPIWKGPLVWPVTKAQPSSRLSKSDQSLEHTIITLAQYKKTTATHHVLIQYLIIKVCDIKQYLSFTTPLPYINIWKTKKRALSRNKNKTREEKGNPQDTHHCHRPFRKAKNSHLC